jgi:hypothetical protein
LAIYILILLIFWCLVSLAGFMRDYIAIDND